MSEWINVVDRLPEYYSEVWVYGYDLFESELCQTGGYLSEGAGWLTVPEHDRMGRVTHWQPLPDPPTPEPRPLEPVD